MRGGKFKEMSKMVELLRKIEKVNRRIQYLSRRIDRRLKEAIRETRRSKCVKIVRKSQGRSK